MPPRYSLNWRGAVEIALAAADPAGPGEARGRLQSGDFGLAIGPGATEEAGDKEDH